MKYDFDQIINRRNTGSLKWNVKENELPLWVADMDFAIAPAIQKAIFERASHPIFGYTEVDKSWREAYVNFYKDLYACSLKEEWLDFSTGVIPSISSTVRALTAPNDYVAILTPVYNIFYNSILNNKRIPLEVPLSFDGLGYSINFPLLEEAFAKKKTTLFILCNPHNPIGRIWKKDELKKISDLAKKHQVIVLSDEIHGPITAPNSSYVPFLSVSDVCVSNSVTCLSVTKAFNLASLQTSALVIPNEAIRKKVIRQLNTDECAEPNAFACPVAVAALNDSREWLKELKIYIQKNRETVKDFLEEHIPGLNLIEGKATYLLWIDIRKITDDSSLFCDFIREKTGLFITPGSHYGRGGEGFVRVNIACPRSRLLEALSRLKEGVSLSKIH